MVDLLKWWSNWNECKWVLRLTCVNISRQPGGNVKTATSHAALALLFPSRHVPFAHKQVDLLINRGRRGKKEAWRPPAHLPDCNDVQRSEQLDRYVACHRFRCEQRMGTVAYWYHGRDFSVRNRDSADVSRWLNPNKFTLKPQSFRVWYFIQYVEWLQPRSLYEEIQLSRRFSTSETLHPLALLSWDRTDHHLFCIQ